MLHRRDIVNEAALGMPVPSMGLELRTVPNVCLHENWPMKAEDLPNLELEYTDKLDNTVVVHFNVRTLAGSDYKRPFQFEERVTEFAQRVGETLDLKLVKRGHNSSVKGMRGRIKDLCDSLYAPHLGSRHMIDSVMAPRILRCNKQTTTFKAFRYSPGMSDRMKQQKIYGVTGFFKLGEDVGYFIIDGAVCSMVTGMPDSGRTYIIDDVDKLVKGYYEHIQMHWPAMSRHGMLIVPSAEHAFDHYELNRMAGEYFFSLSDKAGDLKPRKILGTIPSRDEHSRDPDERWHNVTAQDIAKQFCASPAQYQKFLSKVTELRIPFTAIFQVDIYDSNCYIYLKSEDTSPLVVIQCTEVAA